MSTNSGRRAVLAAMLANAGIAVTKFAAFAVSGSAAMLSEAIHSVVDTVNQVLLLFGASQARRSPSQARPFGYGRARYLSAFVVAVVLFLGGGVFAVVEGLHKWQHPEFDSRDAWLPILVLSVALGLETWSLRTALDESRRLRSGMSLASFIRKTRQPELPVVLLEDLGALMGLVIALVAVILSLVTGDGRWDGVGAMAIGVLLVCVAAVLFVKLTSMLLGESAPPEAEAAIESAVANHPFFGALIHLRTAHMGPDELIVGIKVAVDADARSGDVSRAIDEVEVDIRRAVPEARWIYIEPDVHRDAETAGA